MHFFNFIQILRECDDNEYYGRIYICGVTITPIVSTEFGYGGVVIFDHTSNTLLKECISSDGYLYKDMNIHSNKVFYWYKDNPDDLVSKIIDVFIENEYRELLLDFLFRLTFTDGVMYREITGVLPESLSKPIFKDDKCSCTD